MANNTDSPTTVWLLILSLSEVIGTALLLFIGCSGSVPGILPHPPDHMEMCVIFGMTVMIIVQIFGHVSGAHINPAVTVAALIFKLVSIPAAGMYVISQFLGAVVGYGALLALIPTESLFHPNVPRFDNSTHAFCTTLPHPKINAFQAVVIEFLSTSVLIFVCCSCWDRRNNNKQDSIPIKFGITIATLAAAMGPFSGASMNPARSFGPAVFTGIWENQWIYWLAPLAASVTTSFFYKYIFDRHPTLNDPDQTELPLNQINSKVQNTRRRSAEEIATI